LAVVAAAALLAVQSGVCSLSETQECLAELLGEDFTGGFTRRDDSGQSREGLFGAGIGDGAVTPPIEPTATPVPASDLTIEVLAYLSRELDSTELAAVVIATNAGDLTELSDEALAALATWGFES